MSWKSFVSLTATKKIGNHHSSSGDILSDNNQSLDQHSRYVLTVESYGGNRSWMVVYGLKQIEFILAIKNVNQTVSPSTGEKTGI